MLPVNDQTINDLEPMQIFGREFVYQQKEVGIVQWRSVVACYAAVLTLLPMVFGIPNWFWSIWALEHAIALLNLKTGEWGNETSVFWCDVYTMLIRSYNTFRLLSMPLQIYFLTELFLPGITLDQRVLLTLTAWLLNVAEHENAVTMPQELDEECRFGTIHKVHHEQRRLQTQRTIYGITWNALGTSIVIVIYTWTIIIIQTHKGFIPMVYSIGFVLMTLRYLLGYQTFIQHDITIDIYQSIAKTILFILVFIV